MITTTAIHVSDSIVDKNAHTFPEGRWGICLNGQTYQQEAVVTCNGFQYATYIGDAGYLCVTRRSLPDGEWKAIVFHDYRIEEHCDVHNVPVIGICPEDGTIHLAFDHHCTPLRYRRSLEGMTDWDSAVPWTARSFGPITDALQGRQQPCVTYPQFFPAPNGTLQLVFRSGGSGDGNWHLWEYSPDSDWKEIGRVFGSEGDYMGSKSRCAYPNPFRYGSDDRLHVTWCWREEPALGTNHDMCYAYSEDFGRTWRNNAGQVVADLTRSPALPICVESRGILIAEIPTFWGQMNQTTQYVDGQGRLHVIGWQNPIEAGEPNLDLNKWRFVHYWRDPQGVWNHQTLPFHGRKPNVAVSMEGTVYVIYCSGKQLDYHDAVAAGQVRIAAAEESSRWTSWRPVWSSDYECIGEPRFDLQRWMSEQVLSIYVQETPERPGNSSSLHVLSLAL